jgi:YVTN family beta-propeller protein
MAMRIPTLRFAGRLLLCVFVWGSSHVLAAQSTRLYVANSGGDDISVIDMATLKLSGEIKLGDHVHGVALQGDGRRLFATVESDNTLRVVDTATNKQISSIKLSGVRPNQCAVTPDGKYVAVPLRQGDGVDIIDTIQEKVVKTLPIKTPHNAYNAGSNRYMFVSSMGSEEINIIDLQTMEYSAHIPVLGMPRPYVLAADGKTMYMALSNLHGFAIADIAEKKVLEKISIPGEHLVLHRVPYETFDTFTHGLALSPDQNEVWLTSLLDDCIYVYDLRSNTVVAHMKTGGGPNWVAFTPDGRYFCVSNTATDDVSIFDVRTRSEAGRIKVGKWPKRLAVGNVPVSSTATASAGT